MNSFLHCQVDDKLYEDNLLIDDFCTIAEVAHAICLCALNFGPSWSEVIFLLPDKM